MCIWQLEKLGGKTTEQALQWGYQSYVLVRLQLRNRSSGATNRFEELHPGTMHGSLSGRCVSTFPGCAARLQHCTDSGGTIVTFCTKLAVGDVIKFLVQDRVVQHSGLVKS